MNILVTGATGFVGRHLVRHLVARGHRLWILSRHGASGRTEHNGQVTVVTGDVTDPVAMGDAVQGMDAVYHLAALRHLWGVPETVYRQVNVIGTQHLLDAAAESGVRRFVYCSSVGVARYPGNTQADERLPYTRPTSQRFYHATKAEAERLVLERARSGRLPAVVVRPVITYGPGDEDGMVTRLIKLLAHKRFLLLGRGENHVDLVYIDDLVAGMEAVLHRGSVGRVYIFSGVAPIPMRTLVEKVCALLDRPMPRGYVPVGLAMGVGWGMEMLYRLLAGRLIPAGNAPFVTRDKVATLTVDRGFSHQRAAQELGYRPIVGYDEGLQRTVAWLYAGRK